ncbi:MAG: zinc-ribbon domain-containing protein [Candidatus Fimivivens sp.]|nr:zinc-ribbon domain-containing protein [Candidatus Fimivivens sp.]
MWCAHCGKELDVESTFCKYCGTKAAKPDVLEDTQRHIPTMPEETGKNQGRSVAETDAQYNHTTEKENPVEKAREEINTEEREAKAKKEQVNFYIAMGVITVCFIIFIFVGPQLANPAYAFGGNAPTISYAEYTKIEMGMTYDEVCKIVGSSGTEIMRSEVEGFQFTIIGWKGEGPDGANATVSFQNGKEIAKAQFGLK